MGLCVTGVIIDYRRQCRLSLITFLQYWPHYLILSHYFVIVTPSVTRSHDLVCSYVWKTKWFGFKCSVVYNIILGRSSKQAEHCIWHVVLGMHYKI